MSKSSPYNTDYWSAQPKHNLLINKQVGADKRLAEKNTNLEFHKYIEQTIKNGYVVIEGAFTEAEVVEANHELSSLSETLEVGGPASIGGRNQFEGLKTRRIYALLNKSRVFDKFPLHPAVVALNNYFLDPGWLLHTMHSINIQPGEDPQALHHDDGFVTLPRPHKPFGSVSTLNNHDAGHVVCHVNPLVNIDG